MAGVFDDSLANGASMMEFSLVSSVQIENGPRKLWPHFGFFYKAVATKIAAYGYDESTGAKIKIVDLGVVNPIGNSITKDAGWKYISKNLSTIPDFVQMGKANSEKSWRVKTFFDRREYLNTAISLNSFLYNDMLICFQIILQFEVQQGGKIFIDNLGKGIYTLKYHAHQIEILISGICLLLLFVMLLFYFRTLCFR